MLNQIPKIFLDIVPGFCHIFFMSLSSDTYGASVLAADANQRSPKNDGLSVSGLDDFWSVDERLVVKPRSNEYEISIDTFFNAQHFVVQDGRRGEKHSHSYRIQVRCRSKALDRQQMIVGFADFRETIHRVTQHYNNSLLNDLPPFKNIQATTEALAAVMFQQLDRFLANDTLTLLAVTLWESPDEGVTYAHRQS